MAASSTWLLLTLAEGFQDDRDDRRMSDPVQGILEALAGVDTPTVCNAMTLLDPSLRGKNYTLDAVIPANPDMSSFTGYALTAKIVSIPAVERRPRRRCERADLRAYYRYLRTGPPAIR